jgi:hypothetical protein
VFTGDEGMLTFTLKFTLLPDKAALPRVRTGTLFMHGDAKPADAAHDCASEAPIKKPMGAEISTRNMKKSLFIIYIIFARYK